jgi:hypothetical protein
MKNVNLEKDIVNAKENSIETFGVILGWFAAISPLGSAERHVQESQALKTNINEQEDFYQTILVPAINNSYIILNALSRKSKYRDPITGNKLILPSLKGLDFEAVCAMVKKQNLNALYLQKKNFRVALL